MSCKLQRTVGVAGVGRAIWSMYHQDISWVYLRKVSLRCSLIEQYMGPSELARDLIGKVNFEVTTEQRFRGSVSTLSQAALKVLSEFYSKSFVQLSEDRH